MADFCDVCFKQIDVFNPCEHQKTSSQAKDVWRETPSIKSGNPALALIVSPVIGLIADWVFPVWSTPWLSAGLTLLLGAPLVALWIKQQSGTKFAQLVLPRNLLNMVFPPLAMKAHDFSGNRTDAIKKWTGVFLASLLLQLVVLTPGNAVALAKAVSSHISDTNGSDLAVICPSPSFTLINSEFTCEVETGVLALTVPARVTITPIINSVDVQVSLN